MSIKSPMKTPMKTPMNRVLGLGSAKEGVGHWWTQRLTSVALVPLFILFLFPFLKAYGAEENAFAAVQTVFGAPFNAVIGILFMAVSFHHLAQGLQVVIEDYVHAKKARTALLVANSLICFALGAASVFAIAKIAFGAA